MFLQCKFIQFADDANANANVSVFDLTSAYTGLVSLIYFLSPFFHCS